MKVGFIGLGIMGSAITSNLMKGGFAVIGYDVDSNALARFAARGGTVVDSASAVAAECRMVLTSLPSSQALQDVAASFSSSAEGSIVAELSTLPLGTKLAAQRTLESKHVTLLDCPLSGTGKQAEVADLAVYASGDRASYEQCLSVFSAFTRVAHYTGGFGNGTKMKIIANLLVAINNVATAEALAIAEQCGLDLASTVEIIASGVGTSRIFELRGPLMAKHSYSPATMKLDVWAKDMDIIRDFAKSLDVYTPLFTATQPLYELARNQQGGSSDTAAVFEVIRSRALLG
jgi:putative dehydrogenase